jgi:hypothetical protein
LLDSDHVAKNQLKIIFPQIFFAFFLRSSKQFNMQLSVCDFIALFQFLNLYTVGRTPWTGVQPVVRLLSTHRTTRTQNKHTQTSMPKIGFEHTTPVFEREKTVHALDRAATVIGT